MPVITDIDRKDGIVKLSVIGNWDLTEIYDALLFNARREILIESKYKILLDLTQTGIDIRHDKSLYNRILSMLDNMSLGCDSEIITRRN